MKYDAFISYKHEKLDMEVAKKLHSALETYHIPKAVQKKTGMKKIERVFRDQEELPIGSDLNDNILSALTESRYLLVVCSTATPDSYWVNKEIETFISLHGRENILAVMVDGEPDKSFPALLLTDDDGNPVEPLAADIRGENKKERDKRFKTEILRILAPVIGCSYDDLKQRHRERIIKRNITIGICAASFIAVCGAAFGIYNARVADKMSKLAKEKANLAQEKTELADNILAEYQEKLENQSRFYAEKSLSVLQEGYRKDAALIALEGLPVSDERPYVPEAEYALAAALHAYDCGAELASETMLEHKYDVTTERLNNDGTMLITVDAGSYVYVWDTATWELLAEISPYLADNNYIEGVRSAYADSTGIYIGSESRLSKYDFEGTVINECDLGDMISCLGIIPEDGNLYVANYDCIYVLDPESFEVISEYDRSEFGMITQDSFMSPDGEMIAFLHFNSDTTANSYLSVLDFRNYEVKTITPTKNHVTKAFITEDDHLCTISIDSDYMSTGTVAPVLDYYDANTGELIFSADIPATMVNLATFSIFVKAQTYEDDGVSKTQIVVIIGDEAFTVDAATGTVIAHMTLSGNTRGLIVNLYDTDGFVAYEDGTIDAVNFRTGRVYANSAYETNSSIMELLVLDGQIAIRSFSSDTVRIMKYHSAPDLEELSEMSSYLSYVTANPAGDAFFAVDAYDSNICYLLDSDGNTVYSNVFETTRPIAAAFYDESFVIANHNEFVVVDPKTGDSDVTTYEDLGIEYSVTEAKFSSNGRYVALSGIFTLYIVDLKDMKMVYESDDDLSVENVVISDDGDVFYAVGKGKNLTKVEISGGKATEYKDDSLRQVSDVSDLDYIQLSPDESRIAMFCIDGKIRVINTEDGSAISEFSYTAQDDCFIRFIENGEKLIVQGDDLTIMIVDANTGEMIRALTATTPIVDLVEDEKGYIALLDGTNTYLLESKSYGMVAAVARAVVYLKSNQSFIQSYSGYLYRTFYKDYKALIKEAENQFPGAVLDTLKRSRYNIG